MPKKLGNGETDQFSITLPVQAVEMLMQLIPTGLFGASRGEVARALILDRLEDLIAKGILNAPPKERRPKQ